MGKFLDEAIEKQVREIFASMAHPVAVLFFSGTENCEYCEETQQLLEEVTALSEKLELHVFDIEKDAQTAKELGIDKTPGFVLAGKEDGKLIDYGIRFFGVPAGGEFTTLIRDLLMVSSRDSGLSEKTREFLKKLDKPVHLQVFITPT